LYWTTSETCKLSQKLKGGVVMSVRKEVADYTRVCDILLNGLNLQFTQTELHLLKAYTQRLQDKLGLKEVAPAYKP
jgi:hypothetical protein